MKKIFLSSSKIWKDRVEIEKFTNSIKQFVNCKISPFDDEFSLGENWENEIYSSIIDCDLFVAVLDKESSPHFIYEIGYAQGAGKKIVLIIKEGSEVPSMFRNHLFYKWDENNFDYLANKIIKELIKTDTKEKIKFSEVLKDSIYNTNHIYKYSSKDFENIIIDMFKKRGYECDFNKDKQDVGYDLLIKNFKDNKNALIECKKYDLNKKVSIDTVIQLFSELVLNQLDIGLIITTSTFTNSAIEYAKKIKNKKILLWDIKKLEEEAAHNNV